MEELEYIKKFTRITLKDICEKANVNQSNLIKGKVKKEKIILIKKLIESKIAELYIINETDEDR